MPRVSHLLLFLPFILTACNTGNNGNNKPIKGHWYKRYTGTVAGLPVVANLFFDGDKGAKDGIVSVGGNYYYRNKSDLMDLEEEEVKGSEIRFTEYPSNEGNDDEKIKHPEWDVHINDTGITGTWHSADGRKTFAVNLKENYEQGSYPFDVITVEDSVSFKGKQDEYQMTAAFNLLTPNAGMNKEDARFIVRALLHELGGDTLGAKDFNEFIKASNKKDFKDYNSTLTEYFKDTGGWKGPSNNREKTLDGTLDYNDRGMVVFGFVMYDYSGGAHPNHWNRYICLDVAGKKVLHLDDLLNVDTVKMQALLEQAARKRFDIKPGDSLGSRLLVHTIPLTNNFIISETGISFHYNPYQIASYVDGDAYFYFSYAQLGDMVKLEFRKRMGN